MHLLVIGVFIIRDCKARTEVGLVGMGYSLEHMPRAMIDETAYPHNRSPGQMLGDWHS